MPAAARPQSAGTPARAHTPPTLPSHSQRETHPALYTRLPADTGYRPGKPQRDTDTATSSHAHKPLPDRTAQKTPTDHQTRQLTATLPVNTCKPADTLPGHTHPPHPTRVNEHRTGHTRAAGTVSHGLLPHNTQITGRPRHIPVRDTPGSTGPPETQLRTLNKLTDEPPTALCSGNPRGEQRQAPGTACVCAATVHARTHTHAYSSVYTHTSVDAHRTVHTHARMRARVLQRVCAGEGTAMGGQVPAPHLLKGSGSDRSTGPAGGSRGALMPGPFHSRGEEPGLPTSQGGRLWFG